MDSRLPKLAFLLLVLFAAVHFSLLYPELPDVIASHFNAQGAPNGWQAKSGFFVALAMITLTMAIIGFAIPLIIGRLPVQLINLPNKRYWLAPERRAQTNAFLEAYFGWFACAIYFVVLVAFNYAAQSNLHPASPPSIAWFFAALIGLAIFAIFWSRLMFTRFRRTRQ